MLNNPKKKDKCNGQCIGLHIFFFIMFLGQQMVLFFLIISNMLIFIETTTVIDCVIDALSILFLIFCLCQEIKLRTTWEIQRTSY